MSTTVVYEAIDDYQVNCERGEISERVEQLLDPPTVGDTLKMGSERLWHIVAVESYVNAGSTIFLALVHPLGAPVPARTEWNQAMQRELHPDVCLNLSDRADRGLDVGSWNMCGKPLTGQLYGGVPTDHPTLLRPVALDWVFDTFDTYTPTGDSFYTAIHVCRCVPLQQPEMAVA